MSNITVNKNEKVCAVCGKAVKSDYCVTDDDYKICYKCCDHANLSSKYMYLEYALANVINIISCDNTENEHQYGVNGVNEITIKQDNILQSNASVEFIPTRKEYGLYIDESQDKWAINRGVFKEKLSKVYSFSDILSFELLEDGTSKLKGGLGGVVVGGVLLGGAGLIAGGILGKKSKDYCSTLMIKITVNNSDAPVEYIKYITSKTKKDSFTYRNSYKLAQRCMSILEVMYNKCVSDNPKQANGNNDNIDIPAEISRYKELLDGGAISLEEYNKKKEQLLNL